MILRSRKCLCRFQLFKTASLRLLFVRILSHACRVFAEFCQLDSKKMFGHSSEYLLEWFKIVPFFTSNEVLSVTKEVVFVFFFFQQDHGYS